MAGIEIDIDCGSDTCGDCVYLRRPTDRWAKSAFCDLFGANVVHKHMTGVSLRRIECIEAQMKAEENK